MASSRRLCSLLVALLLATGCAGLRVNESAFPGVWTVRAGDARDDQALRSIVSSAAVQVYIQYAAARDPQTLATIRVRGGDTSPSSPSWSEFSSSTPGELVVASDVVIDAVEITVHKKQQLWHVTAAGYADVAADQDVLASEDAQATITATATSAGDVYLPPQLKLRVAALNLESRGFGSVRLVASDVDAGSINLRTSSGGAVKLHAQSLKVEKTVSVRVVSYGGVTLSAETLHATQLNVSTTSSGDAAFGIDDALSSAVAQCEYHARSAGRIKAGTVACVNANVQSTGAGVVTVRVSNALAYSVTSFGSVYYTGTRPHAITSTSGRQDYSLQAAGSTEPTSTVHWWAGTYALPNHTPFTISPEERAADAAAEASAKDAADPTEAKVPKQKFPWQIVGIVAVLVVVIVVRNSRRERGHGHTDERSRLLEEDAPVYI